MFRNLTKKIHPFMRMVGKPNSKFISTEAMRLNASLASIDPELAGSLEKEKERQKKTISLIPSENFAPKYVMEVMGSILTNKYSEGYPGRRYYGGNEHIDAIENLCIKRALEAFQLNEKEWGVNVQPLSGSPANFAVYTGILQPHDRIMGLDLPHGGHLSHGYETAGKKVSAVSKFYESIPYKVNETTGIIDYDELEKFAVRIKPKMIIAGTSSYSRSLDYERFRKIADQVGAYLLADMAHVSGLVAAGVSPSPFKMCDIVTTTTHKSLRGPRGAMIFFRKGYKGTDKAGNAVYYDMEDKINWAVFPGLQGGPHENVVAALAVALKEAATPEFKEYQKQVVLNTKVLCAELQKRNYSIVSGGTDNHLLLVDLRSKGINGSKMETLCEIVGITLNKNTIPSDKSAMYPNGIRLGSPAMTSRGLVEKDFAQIAEFLDEAVQCAVDIQKSTGMKLVDFVQYIKSKDLPMIIQLKKKIEEFASSFPAVG